MQQLEEKMNKLGFENYYSHPLLQKISTASKQPPFVVVAGFLALFVILIFSPLGYLLTISLSFLIPAYQTFKALET